MEAAALVVAVVLGGGGILGAVFNWSTLRSQRRRESNLEVTIYLTQREAVMDDRHGAVPPRVTGPHRLWSLYDMLVQLNGTRLIAAIANVTRDVIAIHQWKDQQELLVQDRPGWIERVAELKAAVSGLPLPISFGPRLERLLIDLERLSTENSDRLLHECNNYIVDLVTELRAHKFLMVSSERSYLYEQLSPVFGTLVEEHLPDASTDIAAAAMFGSRGMDGCGLSPDARSGSRAAQTCGEPRNP